MESEIANEKPKAAVSWSSGKDSAFALLEVLRKGNFNIVSLLTTVTSTYDRISMHGVRNELLQKQSDSIGIPSLKIEIPPKCSNEIYEGKMKSATEQLKRKGVEYLIFGDIFLEDVRKYRETKLAGSGITPVFPLWGRKTPDLAKEIIRSGISARLVCLDPAKVGKEFGGLRFDLSLLNRLPENVDPCGENGEFHTFVYEAPFFNKRVDVEVGISVERDGFLFTDLVPAGD